MRFRFGRKNLSKAVFEGVTFQRCNWQGLKLQDCSFVDCLFENCNLSLIEATGTSFVNIKFVDSKVMGVNWSKIRGFMGVSLSFENCNLDYSRFAEVSFLKSKIYNCSSKQADFFKSDLSQCDCRKSDFSESNFGSSKLIKADFREASNYFVDIFENAKNLKGAKFSHLEVENLLTPLQIEID